MPGCMFMHVDNEDAAADQEQGDQGEDVQGLAGFPKEDGGKDHAEDRGQEAKDGYLADRIVFQQDVPDRIGDGADQDHTSAVGAILFAQMSPQSERARL